MKSSLPTYGIQKYENKQILVHMKTHHILIQTHFHVAKEKCQFRLESEFTSIKIPLQLTHFGNYIKLSNQ